jgi:hypothetical protein
MTSNASWESTVLPNGMHSRLVESPPHAAPESTQPCRLVVGKEYRDSSDAQCRGTTTGEPYKGDERELVREDPVGDQRT